MGELCWFLFSGARPGHSSGCWIAPRRQEAVKNGWRVTRSSKHFHLELFASKVFQNLQFIGWRLAFVSWGFFSMKTNPKVVVSEFDLCVETDCPIWQACFNWVIQSQKKLNDPAEWLCELGSVTDHHGIWTCRVWMMGGIAPKRSIEWPVGWGVIHWDPLQQSI